METSMTIEQYIKIQAANLHKRVYIAPDIADNKMNGGINGITSGEIDPDHVLAIVDTSILGNGREGCLFTGEYIYIKRIARNKIGLKLSDIRDVEYSVESTTKRNGKIVEEEKLILTMEDGEEKDIGSDLNGINVSQLSEMLKEIINMAAEGVEFTSSSQSMPLSMMAPEVKKSYLKLLCNFSYSNDNLIDSQEYEEVTSLMVRIDIDSDDRIEIRNYIFNPDTRIDNSELLNILKEGLSQDQFETIKKSLIKDTLYISRKINKEESWKDNQYIIQLQEELGIDDEQIDVIQDAIIHDEDILLMRKNDSQIKKAIKDMVAKTAAVGIPLSAVYLSGSVVGISAAGITSGLASLGMGGLLEFSSMFTGLGVAVLTGSGANKSLGEISGIGDLEDNRQREAILQEIIINTQKSLNMMIEDINTISGRLIEISKKQGEGGGNIDKLTSFLEILSKSARLTSDHISYIEKERVIAQLPMKLDISRLTELTDSPAKKKYRDIVLSSYISRNEKGEDGIEKVVYVLDDTMNSGDLRKLAKIIDYLGYNKLADASLASLKSGSKKLMGNIFGD